MGLGPVLVAQAQQLEEIIVTAQRREQSLQDVPVSLQTFSGDAMSDKGFDTLNELTYYAPGLVVKSTSEEQGLILRGAGTQSKNLGIEQGVPTFIDGIHFGRGSQVLNSYMDIERLEVLKGPQPVFFGQNAAAGALNITTRKPGDTWEGYVSGDYGRFGKAKCYRLEGFLRDWWTGEKFPQREYKTIRLSTQWQPTENFSASWKVEVAHNNLGPRAQPLVFDRFAFTDPKLVHGESAPIVGLFSTNVSPVDQPVGKFTRMGIKYGPTFIHPDAESDAREQAGLPRLTEASSSNAGMLLSFAMCQNAGGLQQLDPGGIQPVRPQELESCDRSDVSSSSPWHAVMDLNYTLDNDIEVNAKTGYSYTRFNNLPYNSGGGAFASNARSRGEFFSQWSQELRVTSPVGGTFEWMAGLYWQQYDLEAWSDAYVASWRLPIRSTRTEEDSRWLSGFATVTYNMNEQFSLDVGARYTDISKDATGKNRIGEYYVWDPINEVPFRLPFGMDLTQGGAAGAARAAALQALITANPWLPNSEVIGRSKITLNCDSLLGATHPAGRITSSRCVDIENSISDSSFDPQVVLRYRPNEDLSLYAKYATSFKSGAFDMGVSTVTRFPEDFPFGPEEYETYELGARGTFMNGRLAAEITGFFTDITGVQVSFIDPILERNITRNIAAQESKGIELSGQFAATDRMTISSYFSLLDATVVEYTNASCVEDEVFAGICVDGVADRSGSEARNAPDWQFTGNVNYELPTIFDGFTSNIDASVYGTDSYTTDRSFSDVVDFPSSWDVSLSYEVGDVEGRWSLLIYGRNLVGNTQRYNPEIDIAGEGTLGSSAQSSLSSFANYGARVKFNFF
jgi:outer membrane receptor protein involved in Fe transport